MAVDTTNSFVTEAEARAALSLPPEEIEHSARLEAVINSSAMVCNHFTRRKLKSRAYSNVFYDGDGSKILLLNEFPIDLTQTFTLLVSSSRSFTESALTRWDFLSSAVGTDYLVDADSGTVERIDGDVFPCVSKSIKASYTAGVAGDSEEGLVAHEAQLIIIQDLYSKIGDQPSISSESIAGESVSYIREGIPTTAKRLLISLQATRMFS